MYKMLLAIALMLFSSVMAQQPQATPEQQQAVQNVVMREAETERNRRLQAEVQIEVLSKQLAAAKAECSKEPAKK